MFPNGKWQTFNLIYQQVAAGEIEKPKFRIRQAADEASPPSDEEIMAFVGNDLVRYLATGRAEDSEEDREHGQDRAESAP